jgi:hypothetical protein
MEAEPPTARALREATSTHVGWRAGEALLRRRRRSHGWTVAQCIAVPTGDAEGDAGRRCIGRTYGDEWKEVSRLDQGRAKMVVTVYLDDCI